MFGVSSIKRPLPVTISTDSYTNGRSVSGYLNTDEYHGYSIKWHYQITQLRNIMLLGATQPSLVLLYYLTTYISCNEDITWGLWEAKEQKK